MAETDAGALMNRWFEEVWTQKNVSKIPELFAEDGVIHALSAGAEDLVGPGGFTPFFKNFIRAFPDMKIIVQETLSRGSIGAVRWLATGTHTGDLMGIPPSGKIISMTGMSFARAENGKLVEGWNNWDELGLLQQIGGLPRPEKALAHHAEPELATG